MSIGERIKEIRIKKHMTQDELAQRLGYRSRSSINKIESDGRDIPRSMVVKFAEVLDVTPGYLMGWEETLPEIPSTLSAPEQHLLDCYRDLNELGQKMLTKFAENCTETDEYKKMLAVSDDDVKEA